MPLPPHLAALFTGLVAAIPSALFPPAGEAQTLVTHGAFDQGWTIATRWLRGIDGKIAKT